jgi:hypothetical protein
MHSPHPKILRVVDRYTRREHRHRVRALILATASGVATIPPAHATAQDSPRSEAAEVEALMTRVAPPSAAAVETFKSAGMKDVAPHGLTAPERAKVAAALASLPAFSKHVLEKRLHNLAFVDGIPGAGTGLTSRMEDTEFFDITLRASIVDEPLSTFLTTKEQYVFTGDGSGMTVAVTGTGTDALTYVLLHESTHVVDRTCGITAEPRSNFETGIWTSDHDMVPPLASSVAATTYFRRAPPLDVAKAASVYDALAQTPFVSLYATASASEDFAELVAWHQILKQHHGNLVIELNDASGETARRWEPLTFPGVQKRFVNVDELLASEGPCPGLS